MSRKPPSPSELKKLGKAVKDHRELLGLSLREFATFAAVSYQTLYRLERGREIELSAFLKLAKTYDIRMP